jgi:hypothetical protein
MDRLAKLIDLKSIITILMVGGLVAGWFLNKVTSEQFIPLVTTVLTFYFAKKDSTGGQV